MTIAFAVTFSSFLFEDNNSFTFYETFLSVSVVRYDLANNFCSIYGRSTYSNCTVFIDEQHSFEFENCTVFSSQVVNEQFLTCFGFELLSLNFYNNVHLLIIFTGYLCQAGHFAPLNLSLFQNQRTKLRLLFLIHNRLTDLFFSFLFYRIFRLFLPSTFTVGRKGRDFLPAMTIHHY